MPTAPAQLLIGLTMFAAIVAARIFTANRTIHSRLLLTGTLALAYVGLTVASASGRVSPELAEQLRSVEHLLLALVVIVFLVSLIINPLRDDRVPDRFPTIVQDAIIVALFAGVATLVLQEKVLAMSAVGAVAVGFALQDTLGNAFAGLAIQVEKPFHVGDWITIAQFEGRVVEVTWRATKLRTKAGNFVIVPNNLISKEAITNYSEPITHTRLSVEVGTTYDCAPNKVKAVLLGAAQRSPLVLASPSPDVLLERFDASAITYTVRFWVSDFAQDSVACDQVRTAIYYALARARIEIPYPTQVQFERTPQQLDADTRDREVSASLSAVPVFRPLSAETQLQLAHASEERLFAAGEVIVRQGDPGASMFVIRSGEIAVTLEPSGQEVARTAAGGYFGEMSLLTGEPRTATVTALVDCTVLEITADTFRDVIYPNPAVIEQVSDIAMQRRLELERTRAAAPSSDENRVTSAGFLDRVKRFLRLS